MTPIPETPMPEEQQEKPLEEQTPETEDAAAPAEEMTPEELPQAEEAPDVEEQEVTEDVPAEPVPELETEEEAPPKPPTKFQLLLRKIGIWALITLVVFAVCGLLAYFQIYRPVVQNVALLQGQLSNVQAELADVQSDLAAVEEQAADAEAALTVSEARVALYQTLNAVTAAQAALDQKNGQDALQALKEAQAAMGELLPVVEADAPEVADQMDTRLKAAISSLSGDFKTTKSDLETLSALLMQQDKIFLDE